MTNEVFARTEQYKFKILTPCDETGMYTVTHYGKKYASPTDVISVSGDKGLRFVLDGFDPKEVEYISEHIVLSEDNEVVNFIKFLMTPESHTVWEMIGVLKSDGTHLTAKEIYEWYMNNRLNKQL